jgi:hypothetical protein
MRALHLLLIMATFLAAATPVPSEACSVPTKPFDPSEFSSGVILEGVIQTSEREGRMISVTLKVEKVLQGQYRSGEYTFSFFPAEYGGECLPASTQVVPKGQRLVVYLERRDAGLWRKGWMHFEEAELRDYRVRVPSAQQR